MERGIAMLLVNGLYHFRPTRVAFRNDFCMSCHLPRRSVQIRTFDVWHLFRIPILPLGFPRRYVTPLILLGIV